MGALSGTGARVTVVAAGFIGCGLLAALPTAIADDGTTQATLGGQADVGGGQMWTVDELEPSSDAIPYRPAGTLWEAEATAQFAQGGVPIVPGFSARTSSGVSYPVLWPVPTAKGVNPSTLPAGGKTEGKIYFDVVGQAPDSVVYSSNGHDVAVWVEPPPTASGGYSPAPHSSAPTVGGISPAAAPQAQPVAPAPAAGTPAPAAGSSGTPVPATGGSSGTPIPAGSTPAASPSAAAATPAPTTPAATTPVPASGSAGTPATGSAGTPTTAGAAEAPAPAGTPATGSAGTPASPAAATPTTTAVVPAPASR